MNIRTITMIIVFSGILLLSAAKIPEWINSPNPVDKEKITAEDELYLKEWISSNYQSAESYLIEKCKKHQLVIIGEQHNIAEHKTFLRDNLSNLYHQCGVRAIGWEFSRASDNDWLNRIINLPEYSEDEVLNFARHQSAHEWNSVEHWDMIRAVWEINSTIKNPEEKMHFFGIDINDDLCDLVEKMGNPENSPEYERTMAIVQKRDLIMAENVISDIMDPGYKGVVFVGRCHDYTHHKLASDNPLSKSIMGNILQEKYGDKVFQIWQYSGWFGIAGRLCEELGVEMVGFDNYDSPFANVLQETGWKFDVPSAFGNLARGFIYLKPLDKLTSNSTYSGFINDELFTKYKKFYEMNYGKTFNNAEELDIYIQKNRW